MTELEKSDALILEELDRLTEERKRIMSIIDERIFALLEIVRPEALDKRLAENQVAQSRPKRSMPGSISPWVEIASAYYGISPKHLLCGGRAQSLANARHVTIWLIRHAGVSFPAVGEAMGGLHHSTCIHGVRRVEATPELLTQAREILARVEHGGEIGKRAA